MYPLDRGLWGPTARITRIRDALAAQVRLEVVSGTRGGRVRSLVRYMLSGRLRGLDGIYVESSTALPGPVDLAFLALAKLLGIRVVTYVRDAYQLYPEYYTVRGPRSWLSRAAFRPAMRLLIAASSRAAFPSRGLAAALVDEPNPLLIPPGAHLGPLVPLDPDARAILYVGSLRQPVQGSEILLEGIERARNAGVEANLLCVVRPGEEPAARLPAWVRVVRAEGDAIEALLPGVAATIIPRLVTPYNDLAVPTKLMDYLAYGRPLVVTGARETAELVSNVGAGIVVDADAEGVARGIRTIMEATPRQRATWGRAARAAAEGNGWDTRARMVLDALQVRPGAGDAR